MPNFFKKDIYYILLILYVSIFVNASYASIDASDAAISQIYSDPQNLFYKVEKALLVEDDTRTFGFNCQQGSYTQAIDGYIRNNFTDTEITLWLDHTEFPRCKAELWSSGSRGKGIFGDSTTADAFCQLMGFEGVVTGTISSSSYSSYASEMTVRHDGTTWVMYPHGSGESHINSLTCGSTSEYINIVGTFTPSYTFTPSPTFTPTNTPEKISYEIPLPNSVIKYSAGEYHTCAITIDNRLYCWGAQDRGAIGDGTTTNKKVPTFIMSGIKDVMTAYLHTCALSLDNELYCFGENQNGQIGNDSVTDAKSPVNVLSNVSSFTLGNEHTCAVKLDGTLWCWGYNTTYGQVGTGNGSANIKVPTQVLEDVAAISNNLEYYNTCAIKTNGDLYCWGGNTPYGQVGVGYSNAHVLEPTRVKNEDGAGYLTDVINVDEGEEHTCAIRRNGDLYCWGGNSYGMVGNGNTTTQNLPVHIITNEKFRKVSLGDYHSCAITRDDRLYCWGGNSDGRTGVGGTQNILTPVQILENVDSVDANYHHTCAVTKNGDLYCWGENSDGRVGNGTFTNQQTPVKVLENVKSVDVGYYHTCALKTDGSLHCFGAHNYGAVGWGDITANVSRPVSVLRDLKSYCTAYSNTCGLDMNDTLWCFGQNNYGQMATGNTTDVKSPRQMMSEVKSYSNGYGNVFLITNDGKLYGTGLNSGDGAGKIGNNGTTNVTTFVNVYPDGYPDMEFKKVEVGYYITCAINLDDDLYCWGGNTYGSLGIGNTNTPQKTPQYVTSNVIKYGHGNYHSCIIKSDDTFWCWGGNSYGQVGNNSTTNVTSPTQILSGETIIDYSFGAEHTCAVTEHNELYCWGSNEYGQTGNNSTSNATTPQIIKTSDDVNLVIADVEALNYNTCAIATNNKLYCWGRNNTGQIGDGTTTSPVRVPYEVMSDVRSVCVGAAHACAVTNEDELYCWGDNQYGQIGIGTTSTAEKSPQYVMSDVQSVQCQESHTCAYKNNGLLYCFGYHGTGQIGIGTDINQNRPREIFDGTKGVGTFCGDCCTHWNYLNLYNSCIPENVNTCNEGKYLCFHSQENPTIICTAPNCCDDASYSLIDSTCYSEGYGVCKQDGTHYCNGDFTDSQVRCNAVQGTPVPEICNGLNDNCDDEELIDEDFGVGNYCDTDEGTGVFECLNEHDVYCDIQITYTPTFTFTKTKNPTKTKTPTKTPTFTRTYTPTPGDSDGDGIRDDVDRCPGKNDNLGFYYNASVDGATHQIYFRDEPYMFTDDTDGDGVINCIDDCPFDDLEEDDPFPFGIVDDNKDKSKQNINKQNASILGQGCEQIPESGIIDMATKTPTIALDENTYTETFTPSNTFTDTFAPTNTFSKTPTFTNTITDTFVPTNTITNTYTLSNTLTYTSTLTDTYTKTFTPSNTSTQTENPTDMYTETFTPSNTFTKTSTFTNSYTQTYTPSYTNTNVILDTYTQTYTPTDTNNTELIDTFTYTYTKTSTPTNTKTNTFTGTYTNTYTQTFTPTFIKEIDIVTPETALVAPIVSKMPRRNTLMVTLPKINHGSINENINKAEAKVKYLIHLRKLKRLGTKDKFYKLGMKILSYHRKNIYKFKNIDKGIYSVRYQIIITKGHKIKTTKWSKRTLIVI